MSVVQEMYARFHTREFKLLIMIKISVAHYALCWIPKKYEGLERSQKEKGVCVKNQRGRG